MSDIFQNYVNNLSTQREKYSARIRAHRVERSRRTNGEVVTSPQSANSSSSRRPRTPQSAVVIPPPQPPPSAPLPPIPGIVSDDSTVLQSTRPRGTSLPASQVEVQRQRNEPPLNFPAELVSPAKASTIIRSPKSSEALGQTIQLDAFPAPKKRAKSSSRPQTAPGPSVLPPPVPSNPVRIRTTSGATPPKRSHSSTALSKSASQSHLPSRLVSPSTNSRPTHLSPSPISAISKRLDLIPLQKVPARPQVPPFITIYGLQPPLKVTAPPPPQAPTDSQRRPYHLLRLLQSTLVQQPSPGTGAHRSGGGGFITPKLYVPSMLWHHPELWTLILDLPDKARLLETLREAMRSLQETSIIHFGPVLFSAIRSPTKLKRNPSVDNVSYGRQGINGVEDPNEWLIALDRFSKVLIDIEKNTGKKLGLGENGASVTKKMMDWSTRVAKKTIGGKGPSNELMDSYVDALTGVCNSSAMLDAHLCALRTIVPGSRPPTRRPTFSRSTTADKPLPSTPAPDFSMDPDVLPPAISQLVPKYSNLPKYVTTAALAHFEKTTQAFSSVVLPLVIGDLAVLIQGLQRMRNGDWMGALL